MPIILKVLTERDPSLREKSKKVSEDEIETAQMDKFVDDMSETMLEKDGIGLAAPQVGRNIRLIIVNTKEGPLAMFNPEITKKSFGKCWEEEGCLSVPDTFGEVKRHKKVTCVYQNTGGDKMKLKAEGLLARIIQHEIDHLDGILFIDKARRIHKITNKKM